MNALQSYSSDDESEEEPVTKKMNKVGDSGTNYDDVGMDISEDSGDNEEAEKEELKRAKPVPKPPPKIEPPPLHHRKPPPTPTETVKNVENRQSLDKAKRRGSSEERTRDDRYSSSNKRERSRERGSREKSSCSSSNNRDYKEARRSPWRDYRRGSRGNERRPGRRSRSRSRDRRRSRSRSRSRERRKRNTRTRSKTRSRTRSHSRSRSRDRDRRKPHEIRKEAQQKLAAYKASNPNFDHNELLKRGMEAQFAEVQKNTGVTLPSYYNPATMNPLKIAEQERKKKLLWGNKNKPEPTPSVEVPSGSNAAIWVNTKFSNDNDGKLAEKFKRLMGVKNAAAAAQATAACPPGLKDGSELLQNQETMFNSMEKQYEMARLATHTHKGFGLGLH